jgi:hypothetical protein
MRFLQSVANAGDRAGVLNVSRGIEPTIPIPIADSCAAEASCPCSRDVTPNTAAAWASFAGSWNDRSAGCINSAASAYDTNDAMTFTKPS